MPTPGQPSPSPQPLCQYEGCDQEIEEHLQNAGVLLCSVHAQSSTHPAPEPTDAGCDMEHYSENGN